MTTETLTPSMTLPTDTDAEQTLASESVESAVSFADLGVDARVVATLARMGIETPTLIQERGIPPLLAGRDVIGQSRTGSGKTIAYGLPLVERMDPRLRRVQALVLVPTRELAGQVASVLMSLGAGRGLRIAQLIGGRSYVPQREALRMGAQIAIGAPGRVLDHLRQGTLDLSHLTFAVLDEADQMLDAGFAPDVERLLSAMPEHRQLALFTATLPQMTTQIAKRFLHEPISVDAGTPESRPASTVTQIAYTVPREHRLNALMVLLDRRRQASGTTLVFGRTKHGVDKLARQLIARGYPVAALHGNMSQNARDRVLADFRSGRSPMLLATNVAARGLDVLSIEQVINYELPESAELFTHRVGRTGRMDNTGEAITLLSPDDMAAWRRFQRDLAMKVRPLPFPLDEIPMNTPATAHGEKPAQEFEASATPSSAVSAELASPERRDEWTERRPDRRPERSAERFNERRGFGAYERRPERGFTRDAAPSAGAGERRPARRPFGDDDRPGRREDVASRWTRPAAEADRRDDYGNDERASRDERRYGYRTDYREGRYERGQDVQSSEGRDFRREDRRDDRPGDGSRDERAPRRDTPRRDTPRRDTRHSEQRLAGRPSGPRRATGGFHSSDARPGRPSSRPAGRSERAGRPGKNRPTRG